MTKLSILYSLLLAFLPSSLVRMLTRGRDSYRGAKIDPKAYAVGRLATKMRQGVPMPSVAQSREQLLKSVALFDAKGPKLARIEDITVQGADGPLNARLFSDHKGIDRLHPTMVFFHGGGFIQGDINSHHALCCKIAKAWGGIVVSVDYRLAPEHPYPAGVDDAIAAYQDLRAKGAELGLDPGRIGVGGDSAGGCFAAIVCQQVTPVPAFQVLIYPVTDGHLNTQSVRDLSDAYLLPKSRMDWFLREYAQDFTDFDDPKFSPGLAADVSGLPPCFMVTGGFDPLMDEGQDYAQRMQAAGVPVTHRHFPGQIHAFVNLTRVVPQGRQAIAEIAEWLRRQA